jgi:nitrite reductase/ring-hydroxylating ferredoxin subunit
VSEGTVEAEEVECSWHGSRFDLRTGEAMGPPADGPVSTYDVRVSGENVEVEI